MNRRQFLTYTVALAVAAPFAKLGMAPTIATLTPSDPKQWIPTQAQVDEWLEYYKIAVRTGCERFTDIMAYAFEMEDGITAAGPIEPTELYGAAERAFRELEHDRNAVAVSQGWGYRAGRDGMPRFNVEYTGPSNQAFGWYNMWEIGDRDRRGVRLPRSPGVTWPDGKRAPFLNRYT